MKRKHVLLILVLMALFLTGCFKEDHPINMEVAKPHHDDEALGVKYYFTLGIGAFEGKRYSLMGTHDSKLAYVITNLERSSSSNHFIVHLWMKNIGNDPITFDIDGFTIISPDGKTYSLDSEYQLNRSVRTSGVEYGYVTIQPEQQKRTILYFNVPGLKLDNLSGWRFGFRSSSHLSITGLFSSLFREKNYVWLYPAYKEETISSLQ